MVIWSSFIDSRSQETLFEYDDLNRVVKITQPDTGQFETFAYTPAGDLQSYVNCREQERQFFYDDAHRLIRIDYLLDPGPAESVLMEYDANGNLTRLTEPNGDQLSMSHDELNRLLTTGRVSAEGPSWALINQFDSRGNRTALLSGLEESEYGQARFGANRYGGAGDLSHIFSAHYNALNQMDSLTDSAENTTLFGFDVDGRLAEVNHPVEDLQTRYRHDLVGKLLESRVALDEDELWKLNYDYNLAGERLSQHSVWADGGNAFEYRPDASGRLIRESINRFVCDGVEDFAAGDSEGTAFGLDGKLRLLAREDDFSATYLDLQRWEMAISEPVATSVQMVQNDGLRWRTSVGDTLRGGRVLPAGTPIDFSNVASDYPHIANAQVADTVGWFEGRMLLRHRTPLTGAFDVQIALSNFNLYGASIGLGVTRDRFETADGASRFPTDLGGAVDANGCDIVIEKDGDYLARFNDEELADVTVTKLRLKRFLDGSDWKLSAYYHDGDDWVTDAAWVGVVDDQELFPFLHLSGKVGYLRWSDFLDTVGDPYPVAGEHESRTYDAGRSVDWTRISWNEVCPSGTDVSFQVAVSEDADGPWSYGSALTTAAGTTITSTTGRYAKFKVSMASDGSATPVINDVQVSHDGTSGSRVTTWSYDQAGNITEQVRVTDVGAETDTRAYDNDLNQLSSSSGGWTYQYDLDGNLIGKNNGTAEDCEKWEFSWSIDGRLIQVTKGIYDATPTLVNMFSVSYSYDQIGRMLWRDDGANVTDYFYDGWDIWKEVTGESVTEYLVPNLGIRSFLRNGELYTLNCDGLNSVRAVTDSDGSLVARMELGAWGETLPGSMDLVSGGLALTFVGGLGVRLDELTGLYYMRHRWYDPASQRFISRDPLGIVAGANLYGYVQGNPTKLVDPSGLVPGRDYGEMIGIPHTEEELRRKDQSASECYDGKLLGGALLVAGALVAPELLLGSLLVGALGGGIVGVGIAAAGGDDLKEGAIQGSVSGGLTAMALAIVGPGAAAAFGGGALGGGVAGSLGFGLGEYGRQSFNVATGRQQAIHGDLIAVSAVLGGGVGLGLLRPFASKLQKITSWAGAGDTATLSPGRWVQMGGASRFNQLLTGRPDYPFKNSITGVVSRCRLSYPKGWEAFKGLIGQRMLGK